MARFFPYDATRASLLHPCRGAFFDGWQPTTEAQWCVELARLAYCRGERVAEALAGVGMRLVGEIAEPDDNGTYAVLARNEQLAILAFRGTQPDDPTDIFDDARFQPVPWSAGGRVHAGFAEALRRVWPTVTPLLAGMEVPLLVTGHSLGAALATLAATLVPTRRLVTFGSPRVGDADFVASLVGRVSAERYVDCCDVVCQVPPLPYQHGGQLHYLDRAGDLHLDPTEAHVLADQAAAHADYVLQHAWRFGNVASRSLADHTPFNYVSAVVGA